MINIIPFLRVNSHMLENFPSISVERVSSQIEHYIHQSLYVDVESDRTMLKNPLRVRTLIAK